jgi:hypothetical protein
MNSPDDELYDIDNRPSNWELRVNMTIGLALQGAVGAGVPFLILYWLDIRRWAMIVIPLMGLVAMVWLGLRYLKRRGTAAKALYAARGGNPAGTSDLLFGQMIYSIEPDGRWKWPKQYYSGE